MSQRREEGGETEAILKDQSVGPKSNDGKYDNFWDRERREERRERRKQF